MVAGGGRTVVGRAHSDSGTGSREVAIARTCEPSRATFFLLFQTAAAANHIATAEKNPGRERGKGGGGMGGSVVKGNIV